MPEALGSKVLITGGAGFIGSRVAKKLLRHGCIVRILDNFSPQIHEHKRLDSELIGKVEVLEGDVRDKIMLERSLSGVDILIHLAAETGTGQSMYEISRYFEVNVQATANILDLLQNNPGMSDLRTIVVASSRAVYGEGSYSCEEHGVVYPTVRCVKRMESGFFDPMCPICQGPLKLIGITESAPFSPVSIYGLTKQVQEQSVLMAARALGLNGFGLRYQNVYGPGQALRNPYTGIIAIFANLARQGFPIEIYEDGEETRDFVFVDDVVDATVSAALFAGTYVGALNVGSGEFTSVRQVAEAIIDYFGSSSPLIFSGRFRVGDIRHNLADLNEVKKIIGYSPRVRFSQGLLSFLRWVETQPLQDQKGYIAAAKELEAKGLMKK